MRNSTHSLKTWPEPFAAMWRGLKNCEIRHNDRDYQVHDVLRLREYYPATKRYSGREILATVLHIQTGFGLPDGLAVMSLHGFSWAITEATDAE